MDCQSHERSVSLTVDSVFAVCARMNMTVALAMAFLLVEELTYVGEVRRKSPGFSEIPGFFPPFDRLEAESAAVEVCGSHLHRIEK